MEYFYLLVYISSWIIGIAFGAFIGVHLAELVIKIEDEFQYWLYNRKK